MCHVSGVWKSLLDSRTKVYIGGVKVFGEEDQDPCGMGVRGIRVGSTRPGGFNEGSTIWCFGEVGSGLR